MSLLIPISVGELWDKRTILMIKTEKIKDEGKLARVRFELAQLPSVEPSPLFAALKRVNEELWEVEDQLRVKERDQEFDAEFVALARAVYVTNDRRAEIKQQINTVSKSAIFEVKDYVEY